MADMYEEVTFRQSKKRLIMTVVIDVMLFIFIIGIFTLLYHIIEYKRHILTLTKNGILLQKGWLTINTTEIPYAKINSVSTKRSLLGNLLGYGDILILSGNDIRDEIFQNIQDPEIVKNEIIARSGVSITTNQQNAEGTTPFYKELEELAKLRDKGIITRAEFEAKKKLILGI